VCKEVGKHREGDESLCTLEAFREAVSKVRPGNWRKECAAIGLHFI
jgi:acid phosphatase